MQIVTLDKKLHDRKGFDCGNPLLNNYLCATSGQHDKKDLSRTFVMTSESEPSKIKGFYSLSLCTVELALLPPSLAQKYPKEIHCALIGRLAVNETNQGQGLGSILLVDAIRKAVGSSESIPMPMIIVDAKDENVRQWYISYGFRVLENQKNRLFLTMKEAKYMIDICN